VPFFTLSRGLPGEPVHEMMIEAVEARFGDIHTGATKLGFLSDNGGAYRAHETHALARALGIEPVHTPVAVRNRTAWSSAS
jgi:putative transposase